MDKENIPFVATDRSVLNLPAIGKNMTFKVIGITNKGKRILVFGHDNTRRNSPIVYNANDVYIIENESIAEYLRQISSMKEDIEIYSSIWYYTEGETEKCFGLFQYPEFGFKITNEINHYSEI